VLGVELIQDISRLSSPVEGFLHRHRHRVKSVLEHGRSDTFVVDFVDRREGLRDAVAVAAYVPPRAGASPASARVLLRRQLRYPVFVAIGQPLFTEVVAGVWERPETLERAAARELEEEAGLIVDTAEIAPLGPPFFPTPGVMTERIYLVSVAVPEAELEAALAHPPPGDGSPFEEGASLWAPTLEEALDALDRDPTEAPEDARPPIADAKTELALRRLWVRLAGGPR
jgi:ADP-ribose pyrophosphatase